MAGTKRKRAMLSFSEGPASAPATFGRSAGGLAAGQSAATLHGAQLSRAAVSASDASCPAPVSAPPAATRSRSSINISSSSNAGSCPLPSAVGDCTARPRGTDATRDQMGAPAINALSPPLQRARANSVCGRRRAPTRDALFGGVQTAAAPASSQAQARAQTAAASHGQVGPCVSAQTEIQAQTQSQTQAQGKVSSQPQSQPQPQSQSRSQVKSQSAHAYPPIN
ncbi:hypothetical protein LPJ57_011357, partial [Coemansia sp. RSA 486]